MGSTAKGIGEAMDAAVRTASQISRLEAELFEARAQAAADEPRALVAAAEAAVATATQQLGYAKEALEIAKAESSGRPRRGGL